MSIVSFSGISSDDVDCIEYDPDKKENLLGIGSYGTFVYRGMYKWPLSGRKEEAAIKRIQKQPGGEFERELVREVNSLQALSHKNVIKYYHALETRHFAFIISELCLGSLINITDIMKDNYERSFPKAWKIYSWPTRKHLLYGVACGLQYIHKKNIVHRDLKPQNILIIKDETCGIGLKAVISDFGLSRQFDTDEISLSRSSSMVGTQGWMANEILTRNRKYAPKPLDVFSYGCLVQFVLSFKRLDDNNHPFGKNDLRNANVREGKRVVYLYKNLTGTSFTTQKQDFYGDAILADILIGICVSIEPQVRPSADEIVDHPFFWNYAKRKQYVCAHFNDLKDDFKKVKTTPPIPKLNSLWLEVGEKDQELEFHEKIPEIWKCFELHNREKFKKSPPDNWKSDIFDGLMRMIRNISEHWNDFAESDPSLSERFGDCDHEIMGLYFFEKIPKSFPVIYVILMSRDSNVYNDEREATMNGKMVEQCKKTLRTILLD